MKKATAALACMSSTIGADLDRLSGMEGSSLRPVVAASRLINHVSQNDPCLACRALEKRTFTNFAERAPSGDQGAT